MKIALCFSGQPRFINKCFSSIRTNVISNYDVDVFAHLWFDEDLINKPYKYGGNGKWVDQRISPDAIKDFVKLYNPKNMIIEKSKTFKDSAILFDQTQHKYYPGSIMSVNEPDFRNRTVNNTLSYFYSLNRVCLLKKEYEYAHDFKYDYVVRCRTDSMVNTLVDYKIYNTNNIHYSNINNQPDGMICDWLIWGASEEMDVCMSVFSTFDLIMEKCCKENNNAWCPELLHRKAIDVHGIECEGHQVNIELPRF
jgi:hypothetical protein